MTFFSMRATSQLNQVLELEFSGEATLAADLIPAFPCRLAPEIQEGFCFTSLPLDICGGFEARAELA